MLADTPSLHLPQSLLNDPRVKYKDDVDIDAVDVLFSFIARSVTANSASADSVKSFCRLREIGIDHLHRPLGVVLHDYAAKLRQDSNYEKISGKFLEASPHDMNCFEANEKVIQMLKTYFYPDSLAKSSSDKIMMIIVIMVDLIGDSLDRGDVTRALTFFEHGLLDVFADCECNHDNFNRLILRMTEWVGNYDSLIDPQRECNFLSRKKLIFVEPKRSPKRRFSQYYDAETDFARDSTLEIKIRKFSVNSSEEMSKVSDILTPVDHHLPETSRTPVDHHLPETSSKDACNGVTNTDPANEAPQLSTAKYGSAENVTTTAIYDILDSYLMSRIPDCTQTITEFKKTVKVLKTPEFAEIEKTLVHYCGEVRKSSLYTRLLMKVLKQAEESQDKGTTFRDIIANHILLPGTDLVLDRVVSIIMLMSDLVLFSLYNEDLALASIYRDVARDVCNSQAEYYNVLTKGCENLRQYNTYWTDKREFDILEDIQYIEAQYNV